MKEADKHILIAGASGVVGGAALKAFTGAGWEVTKLGRSPKSPAKVPHLSVDLSDAVALGTHQDTLQKVTHLFYSALVPDPDPGVEADMNASMMENLVHTLQHAGAPLKHIIFIQGGKVYGAHLGVYKTPAREEDSRHFPPNLYFRHEDFARSLEVTGVRWTALRPDIVIGHSLGSSMNLGNLIGIYGALCKETGTAMQFPGPDAAYRNALVNITSAEVLGKAAVWAAESGVQGAYNVTNGDVFRWSHVWPKLARWFGVEVGEPQPLSLSSRLKAMQAYWKEVAVRYGLAESELDSIARVLFGDFIFHVQTDAIFDVTKARRAGFNAMNLRSDDVLLTHLENMRSLELIP